MVLRDVPTQSAAPVPSPAEYPAQALSAFSHSQQSSENFLLPLLPTAWEAGRAGLSPTEGGDTVVLSALQALFHSVLTTTQYIECSF